jgi:hypothetical protein
MGENREFEQQKNLQKISYVFGIINYGPQLLTYNYRCYYTF